MKNMINIPPHTHSDPIIFALSLDKKRQKEHIVFGVSTQVRSYLDGLSGASVLFHAERPLGTFLFEIESQSQADWNLHAHSLLAEALVSPVGRTEKVEKAKKYLKDMLASGNAVCRFTACKSLSVYEYLQKPFDLTDKRSDYEYRAANISRAFKQVIWGGDKSISVAQSLKRVQKTLETNGFAPDTRAEIHYPSRTGQDEWIIVSDSLYPTILYYLSRLNDWKLCFCNCTNCKTVFVAPSKHYSLCSNACRQVQRRQNKRAFDERAQSNGYDIDYKNVTQRMRNRLSSLKKQPDVTTVELQKAQETFVSFRGSALERKKNVKTPEDRKEFQNWLFAQERAFEDICLSARDSKTT